MSIGYESGVIFPVRVVPQDSAKPVSLRMKIEYAVCRNLCVPAEGRAEINLPGPAGSLDAALAAAEARVPKPASIGDAGMLAIRSVRREAASPHPRVIVELVAPPSSKVDLFAEGPTPDWALPLPAPVADAPAGLRRFVFELDGLPPGANADGVFLTLTAVSDQGAIEVSARLD
jgi:DsbC/DsbD-like thiol-disulfide interchange protein